MHTYDQNLLHVTEALTWDSRLFDLAPEQVTDILFEAPSDPLTLDRRFYGGIT
jgi:hypothetical protein